MFQTIGLISRSGNRNPAIDASLEVLQRYLLSRRLTVIVEEETALALPQLSLQQMSREKIASACDLIIVVGGDGSLLSAARAVVDHDTPLLGINRGQLGFLTDISPEEIVNKVGQVLDGEYIEEQRFLLSTTIEHAGYHQDNGVALNDVVLMPGEVPKMIEFATYINDQFLCNQRADGLIIATPTGSTAYALSAGGPILHPGLAAIALVPMFPHTLSSRPIVVDSNSRIKIVIAETQEVCPRLSCDGQMRVTIAPQSVICVQRKSKQLRLIHPKNYSFFATLRNKLYRQAH